MSGDVVTRAVIDTDGFRFVKLKEIRDVNFLPGGIKFDYLPGMIAVSAPAKLWLAGEIKKGDRLINAVYQAVGATDQITFESGAGDAIAWLLK